jgi:hypothetical protein
MNDHVPDFSGKSQAVSAPELPVENEASSDSGAQSKPNPIRNPAAGPDPAFSDAESVGVIFNQDRQIKAFLELKPQRVVPHGGQIGGEEHPAALVINLSGNTEANPNNRAAKVSGGFNLGPTLGNQPLSRLHDAKGDVRNSLLPPKYAPRDINQSGSHMGPAQIHSDNRLCAHSVSWLACFVWMFL